MKVMKRTFSIAAVLTLGALLCVFLTVLALAACSGKVTLRFETDGGTQFESVEGITGASYAQPNEPKKEGYYFDGWYLSDDFSGERQELPPKMPGESRIYYAKYVRYPVLRLDPVGGKLDRCEHPVRAGTALNDYLRAYVPQKEGLVFGGWYHGNKPVEDDVMPQEDLTLTARYKAKYEVNIYLQDANDPNAFEKSEEWSEKNLGWEGATLFPKLPSPEHFYPDEARNATHSRILRAGENVLDFYFLREEVTLTCVVDAPDGERLEHKIDTRYGAQVELPECGISVDGYEFFGWAEVRNGVAVLSPGDFVTMGAEDMTFYNSWAKRYKNARGVGFLAVEEYAQNGKHRAVFTSGGEKREGELDDKTNLFTAGEVLGRLDGRGGFLLDDSGSYTGYGLALNCADAQEYGTLILDFRAGSAAYILGGQRTDGTYEYEWDDTKKSYTGRYFFRQSDGTGFLFVLKKDTFLREGEENGSYVNSDEKTLTEDILTLDGFGGAVLKRGEKTFQGNYCGSGPGEGDWQFESDEIVFRFKLDSGGYKVFDPALYGEYRGEFGSKLVMDGYGGGVYTMYDGTPCAVKVSRDGNIVELTGENLRVFYVLCDNGRMTIFIEDEDTKSP